MHRCFAIILKTIHLSASRQLLFARFYIVDKSNKQGR